MDNKGIFEDIQSRTYTREEVISLISKYQATPVDYMIQTYFNIFEITEGDLYERFERRLNNIILNNVKKIIEKLTTTVFFAKALNILEEELSSVTYASCIYPHNVIDGLCPVIIQYFSQVHGIEHRIISFIPSRFDLNTSLVNFNVVEKLVGYCGDFSYNDPGIAHYQTDTFTSLRLLNGGTIRYLPYSDGFISNLFDLLLDYFPENINSSLVLLGETLTAASTKTQFVRDLVQKYKHWVNNGRRPHLLLTDFTKDVIEHYSLISSYLEPFQCLPCSIEALVGRVLQRFLLTFIREVFLKVEEIKLMDNCAVMYYRQLTQIRDLFKLYEQSHYVPPRALMYFKKETEELIENRILDGTDDEGNIKILFAEIMKTTNTCYVRAIEYITPLIDHFNDFHVFTWIYLDRSMIVEEDVHQTYHNVYNTDCWRCPSLLREVKDLNLFLSKYSVFDMEGSVVSKWIFTLKSCRSLGMIAKLLEYLFALPASYELIEGTVEGGVSDYDLCKQIIHFNLKKMHHESVLDNVKEFFGEPYLGEAHKVIKNNQISIFVD